MTPITVTLMLRFEHAFNRLMTLDTPGNIIYHQGVFYFICEMHFRDAMAAFQQHKSAHRLMLFAQFAFRLEGDNVVSLIKNRREFEETEIVLRDHGWVARVDDGGCRPVQDF